MRTEAKKGHIVYLGLSGFPFGLAAIQRQKLLARCLVENGWEVTIVCPGSVNGSPLTKRTGRYDGIKYVYVFSPLRDKSFVKRNLKRVFGPVFELAVLSKLNRKSKITAAIVTNTNSFGYAVVSSFYSKILNFKTLANLVEIYKSRENAGSFKKMNDFLFNDFGLYFFNAYLPISHAIVEQFKKFKKQFLYIPVLVDSAKFEITDCSNEFDNYFIFCGAAGYPKSIAFVLNAFEKADDNTSNLLLVANGSSHEVALIKELIKGSAKKDKVFLMKDLSEHQLYCYFKNAKALLLPLLDNTQDRARFPHKLGEYLASGNVVVANEVGELKYYLKNLETALLSPAGDVEKFADNMDWVMDHPSESATIGAKGKNVCINHFDVSTVGKPLSDFLDRINIIKR